jgi:agmatinase
MTRDWPRLSEWNAYDLAPSLRDWETATFALLLLPYERTTTYLRGTRRGPEAFLNASQQVELYDVELGISPCRAGIYAARLEFEEDVPIEECLSRIRGAAAQLLNSGKRVIAIGGEHTVTLPLVEAHKASYPDLQVVQFDAHADLRDEFEGSPFNHACVMRRIHALAPHVGIGIRSVSQEEAAFSRSENIPLFLARDLVRGACTVDDVLRAIHPERPVYLTIDLDCFDPSEAPGVGTPEPGGLSWYAALELLEAVIRQRQVIGADVVELRPLADSAATEFLAAKLVYRIIGLFQEPFR